MSDGLQRPLGAYRVVELAGAEPMQFGKTFADLGAEVVKLEPPGGDPSRLLPPFATGANGEPVSLYWTAYSAGKQSFTAEIESEAGRDAIRRLAAAADVLVEAYPPGYLDGLDLGYDALRHVNPRLVMTSITPFGQSGPFAGRKGSDLVHLAMSGYLNMTGPPDGPPIKPSAPYQTYLHGSMQAVAATLLALRQRRQTGLGTRVDQAMRDTGLWMLTHTYQFWDLQRLNLKRQGAARDVGGVLRLPNVWQAADGYIVWVYQAGHVGGPRLHLLVAWMDEHGLAPEWLKAIEWKTFDLLSAGAEMNRRLVEAFSAFFVTKRKAELFEWALPRGVMLAPVQTLRDVAGDVQLAARGAWRQIQSGGLERSVRLPGPPVRMSGADWEVRTSPPAPLLPGRGASIDEVVAIEGDATPGAPLESRFSPLTDPATYDRPFIESGKGTGVRRSPGPANLPLAGIRVIDFSTTVAGPSASRHLADFGAEVIKVESNTHPDTLRAATPYAGGVAGVNRSAYFAAYNAGKRSLSLNMRKPEAREIVRRLVERSDVLIEAFVPGVMQRWGLGYEQVSAWNPRIVMASHCLQGQTGPHASHRGYGQIASAMSGWYDLTGPKGGEPLGPYSAYTDFICWPYLLTAILVALEVREESGRGQYIDHAQLESSIQFLAAPLLDLELNDRVLTRHGNHETYACPNNVYPCAGDDRWMAITVGGDEEWRSLCEAFGHPEAAVDPRFAALGGRKEHEEELDALLSAWTAGEEPFALAERLQTAGIAAGVVARAEDLFDDPQLQHRGFFRSLEHPELGEHAVLTQSFRIHGMEAGPRRAAPLLGEHTHAVCSEVLGMSEDEIADFAAAGIFE